MRKTTNQFSFMLKPSKYGVGVFATHDIAKNTSLRLFGENKEQKSDSVILKKSVIPRIFRGYCISRGEKMIAPKDFGKMAVGWFINHSKKPNIFHKNLNWFALKNIKKREELLADYNSLGEPKKDKEKYYKK